jgi:hypothetical protein
MRDALRNLATVDESTATGGAHDSWHEALASVLYMQFLALESARKAVRDLIEFEPNEAENTITILVSELTAFGFLLEHFGRQDRGATAGDFRHARLALRKDEYKRTVAWAYWRADDGDTFWKQHERDLGEQTLLSPADQAKADTVADVARQWGRTRETANELEKRFKELFPGATIERPPGLPKPNADCLLA